jgi:hypothetical protein
MIRAALDSGGEAIETCLGSSSAIGAALNQAFSFQGKEAANNDTPINDAGGRCGLALLRAAAAMLLVVLPCAAGVLGIAIAWEMRLRYLASQRRGMNF